MQQTTQKKTKPKQQMNEMKHTTKKMIEQKYIASQVGFSFENYNIALDIQLPHHISLSERKLCLQNTIRYVMIWNKSLNCTVVIRKDVMHFYKCWHTLRCLLNISTDASLLLMNTSWFYTFWLKQMGSIKLIQAALRTEFTRKREL